MDKKLEYQIKKRWDKYRLQEQEELLTEGGEYYSTMAEFFDALNDLYYACFGTARGKVKHPLQHFMYSWDEDDTQAELERSGYNKTTIEDKKLSLIIEKIENSTIPLSVDVIDLQTASATLKNEVETEGIAWEN